jgi:hypothetical protein
MNRNGYCKMYGGDTVPFKMCYCLDPIRMQRNDVKPYPVHSSYVHTNQDALSSLLSYCRTVSP